MTREVFDELWKHIILSIFNDMNKNNVLHLKKDAKEKVYKQYQNKKTYIKDNYMLSCNTHLDRHKIASCVLYAIMQVYPIEVNLSMIKKKHDSKEMFPKEYQLLNEYLALYTAFSIIESFRQYGIHHSEEEFPTKGFNRHKISIPNTSNGQDYIYNTCLDLYFSKQKKNINVLTFSNVFFLLEITQVE